MPGRVFAAAVVLAGVASFAAGCASSTGGSRPRPFPTASRPRAPLPPATDPGTAAPAGPAAPHLVPPPPDLALAHALTNRAMLLLGTPYRNGGADPRGFDCSGFIEWVFAAEGVRVPRTVVEQFRVGSAVPRADIAPGDLLFFATTSNGPSHVGLALGDGDFVHAPSSRGRVRLDRLASNYWATRFIGARRITRPRPGVEETSGSQRPAPGTTRR